MKPITLDKNEMNMYLAVRRSDDGCTYVDFSTASGSAEGARWNASDRDKAIPGWAKANRQVGIAKARLIVEEVMR